VAAVVSAAAVWSKISDGKRDRAAQASADEVRKNLDQHQRDYLDRLERRLVASEARGDLWEARARRVDRVAHNMRHEVNNHRQRMGQTEVAQVPLLEDPIDPPEDGGA